MHSIGRYRLRRVRRRRTAAGPCPEIYNRASSCGGASNPRPLCPPRIGAPIPPPPERGFAGASAQDPALTHDGSRSRFGFRIKTFANGRTPTDEVTRWPRVSGSGTYSVPSDSIILQPSRTVRLKSIAPSIRRLRHLLTCLSGGSTSLMPRPGSPWLRRDPSSPTKADHQVKRTDRTPGGHRGFNLDSIRGIPRPPPTWTNFASGRILHEIPRRRPITASQEVFSHAHPTALCGAANQDIGREPGAADFGRRAHRAGPLW